MAKEKRKPANRTRRRTPKKEVWRPLFIQELARTCNVSASAIKAGVDRRTVYNARESDPEFAAAWDEALEVGVELMEAEARRRAFDGTLRPVFQGGEEVGRVREYSDTLAIFLLKAHRPEKYRDNAKVVVAGDPTAPVKHEHAVTVTGRIDELAAAFASAAGREEAGGVPGDGAGKPVDP